MRLLALLALVAACASTPPPPPTTLDSGIVALAVTVSYDVFHHRVPHPWNVYFVRFEEGKNPGRQPKVLKSDVRYGSTHYLLDAKPGRYAAVACFENRDGRYIHTYFSEELIAETARTLGPREVVFLGHANIKTAQMVKQADESQRWYLSIIDPKLFHAQGLGSVVTRSIARLDHSYVLTRNEKKIASFRKYTGNVLSGSEWSGKVTYAD